MCWDCISSRVGCRQRFVFVLRRGYVWCTSSSPSSTFQCQSTLPKWSFIFRFRDEICELILAVNLVYVNRRDVIRALVRTRFVSLAEFDRLVLKMFWAQHCKEGPGVWRHITGRLLDSRQRNGGSCNLLATGFSLVEFQVMGASLWELIWLAPVTANQNADLEIESNRRSV